MIRYALRTPANVQLALLRYLQHLSKVKEGADVCILYSVPTCEMDRGLYAMEGGAV